MPELLYKRRVAKKVKTLHVENGRVGSGVTLRIERIPVQAPLGARPGFGTEPRYEASGGLWVE